MLPCNQLLRVYNGLFLYPGGSGRVLYEARRGLGFVALEYLQPPQLLVDERQGLKALRLEDLLVEPCLDFVLGRLGKFLVNIVDVAIQLEKGDHLLLADGADKLIVGGSSIAGTGKADVGDEEILWQVWKRARRGRYCRRVGGGGAEVGNGRVAVVGPGKWARRS